ncbi:Aminopeptidase PepS [Pontimonas salivibrio]|uniref:Aminopeptidase PepS n=1 Tax=Pontimonas salivibrio TaxID=1159327 RepID=A0A2L2BRB2_9MICO|nr:aminopeptidase [Pontimonas salivibrio]AVG24200.1 Aminopeptidase PepS [Pontimonas salivibrio]
MSPDSRWADLARQLARGTQLSAGDKASIFMTDAGAMPAVEAFVEECYRCGAEPAVLLTTDEFDRAALRHLPDEVLHIAPGLELAAMEWSDVHVSFRSMVPPGPNLSPRRSALQRRGKGLVSQARWESTRWCLVRVPTPEWADFIGEDFSQVQEEFFAGTLADWDALSSQQSDLCEHLNSATWVRVTSTDTDLTFGVKGRSWVGFAGEANLPDGEVATAPLDDEVDGHITFPGTFWFAGVAISDLRLVFERGLVVSAEASEGADFVTTLLESDPGARRVGELGIGTNSLIRTFTGDLLIDEKIMGTMHLALGRAYPECGGINESSIHWDIVKDLRSQGGAVESDVGTLISGGAPGALLAPFAD